MANQKNQNPQLSEGESNSSKRRAEWQEESHNSKTRKVLEQDANFFINQAVSSPCLSVEKKQKEPALKTQMGEVIWTFMEAMYIT